MRGTGYLSKPGVKWIHGSTERETVRPSPTATHPGDKHGGRDPGVDELAPRVVVLLGEQRLDGDVDEVRVAVCPGPETAVSFWPVSRPPPPHANVPCKSDLLRTTENASGAKRALTLN
jgi:hypothetical protein